MILLKKNVQVGWYERFRLAISKSAAAHQTAPAKPNIETSLRHQPKRLLCPIVTRFIRIETQQHLAIRRSLEPFSPSDV